MKYGTDLITFYAPKYWGGEGGLGDLQHVLAEGGWALEQVWQRMLDGVVEAGLDGIEITFPPGDWRGAKATFGSASGFASELANRGLELSGGFFIGRLDDGTRVSFLEKDDHAAILDLTAEYAEFLSACGSDVMVAALPTRPSLESDPPGFVDLALAERLASLLNDMGAVSLRNGVRLSLHPEAFSMFRNSRDVDLFMLLTDPTYVHLCPDLAQFVVAGSDPVRIVDRHRDRVICTHWKDAIGSAPVDTPIDSTIYSRMVEWFTGIGRGVVDWPAWMRVLRDMQYKGWALFELDLAACPVHELRQCREFVQNTLSHIYE